MSSIEAKSTRNTNMRPVIPNTAGPSWTLQSLLLDRLKVGKRIQRNVQAIYTTFHLYGLG